MTSVLIISGLDPSGGAGFIADVRVVERHGLRAVGAISALTEQTTAGVRAVSSPGAELLAAQLTALLADVEVAAGKIGLLADEDCCAAAAEALALTGAPVVWDPVLRASAGDVALFRGDPRRALALLADHVALVTPNLAEAEVLCGFPVRDRDGMRRAAADLAARGVACLVKGGHLGGAAGAADVLAAAGRLIEIEGEMVPGGERVHGTGCALSTAIACRLAGGDDLETACRGAAAWLRDRLREPVTSGRGRPSVM
ncbi:MAG TPA: bifunctional hydroxymethylpyrimidine kinase/phosphomethylpyrimidine kinase [Kofleriaceae bacterium]|nr:bifunctional hydroxymethylpyrimidine kinase/phosphomethylpyrimidine kinase [Kofleriaceae bacterium]